MITVTAAISYERQSVPPIIPMVQGDTGRNISFELTDYTIPTGATATFYIQKPSGLPVYNNATVLSATQVLVPLDAQCLAESGENYLQARILLNNKVITSFDAILNVKPFRGISAVESKAELNVFDQKIAEAESYAKGGTGIREGENTDNAKYYKEQAGVSAQSAATAKDAAETAKTAAQSAATSAEISKDAAEAIAQSMSAQSGVSGTIRIDGVLYATYCFVENGIPYTRLSEIVET